MTNTPAIHVLPTARIRQLRCPRCGNSFFPQGTSAPPIECPVVGCNTAFDPDKLPTFHPDEPRKNFLIGTATLHGQPVSTPLLFGRNEPGEIIVTGVEGNPDNLVIPDGFNGRAVMGVGPGALRNQAQLHQVTLPDTVARIGEEAFAGCTALESVTFGSGLEQLDTACFRGCTALGSVTLPDKVASIGREAFAGCTSLTKATLPGQLQDIRDGVFLQCEQLMELICPARPALVAPAAFAGCYALPQEVQDALFTNPQ